MITRALATGCGFAVALVTVAACTVEPVNEVPASRAAADSVEALSSAVTLDQLIESRVPAAVAGQPGWLYQQRARADFDGDTVEETAVLISDVGVDEQGRPLWEHGHRWQVYVEEADSTRTYLFARFLPNGTLTADVGAADSTHPRPTIVLAEDTPHSVAVYELRYDGPRQARVVRSFERAVDVTRFFLGSPRP